MLTRMLVMLLTKNLIGPASQQGIVVCIAAGFSAARTIVGPFRGFVNRHFGQISGLR
jgi:hypothetical protein